MKYKSLSTTASPKSKARIFPTFSLLLCIIGFSGFMAFHQRAPVADADDIDTLIRALKSNGELNWKMVREEDPFRREVQTWTDNVPASIALTAEGRFDMEKGDTRQKGRFRINREEGSLTFYFHYVNGKPVRDVYHLKYYLDSYERNRLVLKWQGRHGWIKQYFVRFSRSEVLAEI